MVADDFNAPVGKLSASETCLGERCALSAQITGKRFSNFVLTLIYSCPTRISCTVLVVQRHGVLTRQVV